MRNKRSYANLGKLDRTRTAFGNILNSDGYAKCVVGKWPLGEEADGPQNFGFDEDNIGHFTQRGNRYKNSAFVTNGKTTNLGGNEYGPDAFSNYALDFVTRQKDVPFFLYFPITLTCSQNSIT